LVELGSIERSTHVEVVANDDHRRVAARALALDLNNSEFAVLGSLAWVNTTEVGADCVEDLGGAFEHARRGRADLDKVLANGLAVEHGVERCDLVNTHGRHVDEASDIVHDADACPAFVLPLAKVKQRDYGCLLILGRVVGDDLLGLLHVVCVEGECNLREWSGPNAVGSLSVHPDLWVVVVCVAVLNVGSARL